MGNAALGSVTVEQLSQTEYALTVNADKEFLEAETTVYPVTVDPTLTISDSNSTVDDATISAVNTTTNYGSQSTLTLGGSTKGYIAMKFPTISSNPTFDLLDASQITSASINFHCSSKGTSTIVYVNQYDPTATVSGYWTEGGITYSGNGIQYIKPACSKNVSATGNVSIDITKLVKEWKDNAVLISKGLLLRINSSYYGNSDYYYNFYSSEASSMTLKPFLSITFNDGGIYQIRNKATGNMLNVQQSSESAHANIYQFAEDNTAGQAFKLVYNSSTNTYRMYAICSNYGNGYVVSRISNVNDIETNTYASSTGDWKLEYSAGYYKIKLNSATLYMSVSGTEDYDEIFLNSSANTDNEKWSLELIHSGGELILDGIELDAQDTRSTCGPASMRMLLMTYNIYKSEQSIITYYLSGIQSPSVGKIVSGLNAILLEEGINVEYGYATGNEHYELSTPIKKYYQILRSLANGNPVIVNIAPKKETYIYPADSDGHYIVIAGIKYISGVRYYVTYDPHPDYPGIYSVSETMLFSHLANEWFVCTNLPY